MSKLKLTDITKTYKNGEVVRALNGISVEFRESEFVSILGPSGCGKTTLLNIIGGLDRYDTGDLELGSMSTKKFKASDWDAYRNHSIGFVFQNYNLIGHQSVLQNVEIAMTLSGVSGNERKRRAKDALESVGLADQIHKRPNQLSGGQMQRVAIARALVNNPDIILADEPTGALDSHTSIQVMEILKKVAEDKLVIMVTHNAELAEEYSSRIIRILDGELQSDTNPIFNDDVESVKLQKNDQGKKQEKIKKTSMSLITATNLSFKNLLSKKWRTVITAFAGSVGIIGVALVLALSSGLSSYMSQMQSDTLSGYPITITESTGTVQVSSSGGGASAIFSNDEEEGKFTEDNILYRYNSEENTVLHTNVLTQDYFDYVANITNELPEAVNVVSYISNIEMNVLASNEDTYVKFETSATAEESTNMQTIQAGSSLYWSEMPDSEDFILSVYDLIGEGSRLPSEANEIAIVVNEYNQLDEAFFEKLGIQETDEEYKLTDFIGKTMLSVIPNDSFYAENENGVFVAASISEYEELYNDEESIPLTITGILRIKESASASVGYLSEGFVYTSALTDYVLENAQSSEIALAQQEVDYDVLTGAEFLSDSIKEQRLTSLGVIGTPTGISIYPKDFEGKDSITDYLDAYNNGKDEEDQILYTDVSEVIGNTISTVLNTVTYVLIGFAAISLFVSTIMIAIITYVSVMERTKEIGILRSVGARKIDISRIFNAETLIIGFIAGTLGVAISYLLTIPINSIIADLVGIEGIAALSPIHGILLVLGSMGLTLIAGLIPAYMASKKDPVIALRTE